MPSVESPAEPELPEELERFRPQPQQTMKDREFHTFARKMTEESYPKHVSAFPPIGTPLTVEEAFRKDEPFQERAPLPERPDKLDLIISKLETIDERMKVIEERLARRVA